MAMANRRSAGEVMTPTICGVIFLTGWRVVIMSGALEGDSCGNESCSRVLYIEGAIFSSSEPSIVGCGTCQHPLDVFGQNVELDVH